MSPPISPREIALHSLGEGGPPGPVYLLGIRRFTYPHRARLRAMGCVWDPARRYWAAPSDEIAAHCCRMMRSGRWAAPTPRQTPQIPLAVRALAWLLSLRRARPR